MLLVPRPIDDDRRCAAKYGELRDAYVRHGRYRIVAGIDRAAGESRRGGPSGNG